MSLRQRRRARRTARRRRAAAASLLVISALFGVLTFARGADAAPSVFVIVGDDAAATGGEWGFHEGYFNDLRSVLTNAANFGEAGTVEATFTVGTPRAVPLTAGSLSGVSVYFLSARELQAGETAVLQAFVQGGGALVLNSNAPGFYDVTSWLGLTLTPRVVYGDGAAPYTTTHRAPSPSTVVAGQANHPVVNGAFGAVPNFENWHTVAGFSAVPAQATALARTTITGPDNNGSSNFITLSNVPTMAVIPAGTMFGAGSGPIVAVSDLDTFSNAYTTGLGYGASDALCTLFGTNNGTLARNTFAWIATQVVPTVTTTSTTSTSTTSSSTTSTSTTSSSTSTSTTTTAPASSTTLPPSGRVGYSSLTSPQRALDTRLGIGGSASAFGSGETREVSLSSVGVPTNATLVAVNITAVEPSMEGYLTAYPSGGALPLVSSVNFTPRVTVANAAFVKVGAGNKISIFNAAGSTHVLIDVTGFVAPGGSRFVATDPARIKDTRRGLGGAGIAGAGETQTLLIAGRGGVPAGARAVALNVTAVDPSATSFVTAWPADQNQPTVSNINTTSNVTSPNMVIVRLPTGGTATGAIRLYNDAGSTHLLVDVLGYFTDSAPNGAVSAVGPQRLVDTRGGSPLASNDVRAFNTGLAGAAAVIVNVTAADGASPGYLTVFPGDGSLPDASNVNYRAGRAAPNLVIVRPRADGTINVYNFGGPTHVLIDVIGRFD